MTERPVAPTLALEDFLPYRLARIAETVSRDFSRLYKARHGLRRPEWRTLATLGQFGTMTATAVGQHSSMHKTMVSRAVTSLEKRGWLSREVDEADRRVEHLSLTVRGRRAYADLVPLAAGFERALLDRLGAASAGDLLSGLDRLEGELGLAGERPGGKGANAASAGVAGGGSECYPPDPSSPQ